MSKEAGLVRVDHAALAPDVAADGRLLGEVDLAVAEVRALQVHVDRAARAVVVLLGAGAAGERGDRALDDLDALHHRRVHEEPRAAPDRHDAVERRLRAAHAADGEAPRLAHEQRRAARLDARHLAQEVVHVRRVLLANEVLGQRVDGAGERLRGLAGERAAHDLFGAVFREGGRLDGDGAEVGDLVGLDVFRGDEAEGGERRSAENGRFHYPVKRRNAPEGSRVPSRRDQDGKETRSRRKEITMSSPMLARSLWR